ncbi:MAG: Error-prone repair homolog of DNA polymerase III alpha subunit, partial [uncultured Rubrobacteraceae bacterium]
GRRRRGAGRIFRPKLRPPAREERVQLRPRDGGAQGARGRGRRHGIPLPCPHGPRRALRRPAFSRGLRGGRPLPHRRRRGHGGDARSRRFPAPRSRGTVGRLRARLPRPLPAAHGLPAAPGRRSLALGRREEEPGLRPRGPAGARRRRGRGLGVPHRGSPVRPRAVAGALQRYRAPGEVRRGPLAPARGVRAGERLRRTLRRRDGGLQEADAGRRVPRGPVRGPDRRHWRGDLPAPPRPPALRGPGGGQGPLAAPTAVLPADRPALPAPTGGDGAPVRGQAGGFEERHGDRPEVRRGGRAARRHRARDPGAERPAARRRDRGRTAGAPGARGGEETLPGGVPRRTRRVPLEGGAEGAPEEGAAGDLGDGLRRILPDRAGGGRDSALPRHPRDGTRERRQLPRRPLPRADHSRPLRPPAPLREVPPRGAR